MTTVDSRLSEAVVVYTGRRDPGATHPQPDEKRVVDVFGSDAAADLVPRVIELVDDFYSSDARHVAHSLAEMAQRASTEFRNRHPEISLEAVEALAWCYTWDFK